LANALQSAANGPSGPGDKAAPLNASVSGLEQITKDLAIAAATAGAGGGAPEKTDKEYLAGIAVDLKNMSNLDLKNLIYNNIIAGADYIFEKIKGATTQAVDHAGAGVLTATGPAGGGLLSGAVAGVANFRAAFGG
jgi:hypothetical protein